MSQKRRYVNISNQRASKAIYRLMMLVRMKLRSENYGLWREKWARAKLKIRGIIAIMAVVKHERKERKLMKKLEKEVQISDMDSINELDELESEADRDQYMRISPKKSTKHIDGKIKAALGLKNI